MRIEGTFLRTRIARRILAVFTLSTFLPLTVATGLTYVYGSRQLRSQAQRELHELVKSQGMSIFDRLSLASAELAGVASAWRGGSSPDGVDATRAGPGELSTLSQVFVARDGSPAIQLAGPPGDPPPFPREARVQLEAGKPVLAVLTGPPRVFVGRATNRASPANEILWGQVRAEFLWDPLSARYSDPSKATCVFDDSDRPLFCSRPMHEPPIRAAGPRGTSSSSDLLEWDESGEARYGATWRLFLGFEFAAPDWTVLSSEARARVLEPLGALRTAFFLVSSLTLAVVFFLANVQIRWTTRPVEKLEEATRLVAQGEFGTRVTIDTNDEFAALAGSFNEMGRQLESHFETLAALTEIDRAVLSVLDQGTIVSTVLKKMRRLIACDEAAIALFDADSDGRLPRATVFVGSDAAAMPLAAATPFLTGGDVVELLRNRDHLWLDRARDSRPYLALEQFGEAGLEHFLALPMIRDETVLGVLLLGYLELPDQRPDELGTARQLADQVAVALSNAQLVNELNELSRGTLTALARAVDAKSEWTFGHSERVAALSVRLARELGLSEAEVEHAYRGGLLHDIGKIGVPRTILDKPGALTDEEMDQVRAHTEIGARILEPIQAFDQIVPVVLHHHERYDGSGYPQGLAGERIPLLARVAAIPDVFDALQSGRPYRAAMSEGKVRQIIREGAGTQFDPEMARVFLEMMEGELVGNVRTG